MNLLYVYVTFVINVVNSKRFLYDHHKHRNLFKPKYFADRQIWDRGFSFDSAAFKETDFPESSSTVHHRLRHHHEIGGEIPWPVKKEAVVEGDLVLGGLMMVHEREDTITCGPVMPQGGIQALEAMLYTLDRLNLAAEPLLPNISLGAHILDDCDKDTYGLEMAVDFIKALL
ncbi:hypothetical protein BDFB_013213 [Asbolus verrucosus]|uniref:Uncharacterized protein n=1 Tax=Asbolus verrucosus TaxID=1661398 RepID=A0A482W688_ASBVE|nr:hypothetical protein BDFB_013213 [Asbolus verrucosus]